MRVYHYATDPNCRSAIEIEELLGNAHDVLAPVCDGASIAHARHVHRESMIKREIDMCDFVLISYRDRSIDDAWLRFTIGQAHLVSQPMLAIRIGQTAAGDNDFPTPFKHVFAIQHGEKVTLADLYQTYHYDRPHDLNDFERWVALAEGYARVSRAGARDQVYCQSFAA